MASECERRRQAIAGAQDAPRAGVTTESVSVFRPVELPGLELLSVQHSARRWRVFHETYSLCAVPLQCNESAGAGEWVYRRRRNVITPGGVMLIEPGETHFNTRVSGHPSYWVFQVEPRQVDEAAHELGQRGRLHFGQAQSYDPRLLRSFVVLHAAVQSPSPRLARESAFAHVLRAVMQHSAEARMGEHHTDTVHPAVRRARDFLHAHYAENVGLSELAAAAGLSRFHLLRSFSAAYGLAPHAYQTQLRVARARALLRQGVSPNEIDVGFADQSHLGRHFKRALGLTPAVYARGSLAAVSPHETPRA